MPVSNSTIGRVVSDLLREDADFERHYGRSAHREAFVRNVQIDVRRPVQQIITAFSRNISSDGIGLITQQRVDFNASAILKIEGLALQPDPIVSECRWCKSYGNNWFLSGWQFMALRR